MLFWVCYLLVAVLGSIGLYCFSPLIPTEKDNSEITQSANSEVTVNTIAAESPAIRTVEKKTPVPIRKKQVIKTQEVSPQPQPVQDTDDNEQDDNETEDDEPEVIVENVVNYKPSTDVIRSSGADVTHWGITVKEAVVYSKDGKNLKTVQAGSLVEQTNSTMSDKGEMSFCKVWGNNSWSGPFLIAGTDLIRFPGTREQTDANDVEKLCKYFSLVQQYENRKKEILKASASKNPYYKELKEKAEVYNKTADRAAELTKQRDDSKGSKRSKIITELTKLKQEEARLSAELIKVKTKYEDWKKKNNQAEADYNNDPVYQKLGKQILDLKYELSDFGI